MKGADLQGAIPRAIRCLHQPSPQCHNALPHRLRRVYAPNTARPLFTASTRRRAELDDFKAAPEIDLNNLSEDGMHAARITRRPFQSRRGYQDTKDDAEGDAEGKHQERLARAKQALMRRIRIIPASPSYFTAKPSFTDDYLSLQALLRKYQTLPVMPPGQAPRVAWKTLQQYKSMVGAEPVKAARYHRLVALLQRLNYINTSIVPEEVTETLERYKRAINPYLVVRRPVVVDEHGRALGVGRRKTSTARAYLVEGEGEVLINGKSLSEYFGRIHDRESAIWALKATERVDKYNLFALVQGGGVTGQAEALTLAVGKALMVHEPLLKPALRRAGCVTRDPRKVERKKPGHLKARKKPAWVKR